MSLHPGQESYADLSDEELSSRYNQLIRRYDIACRMNMDRNVLHQMELLLNSIDDEKLNRIAAPTDDIVVVIDTDAPSSWDDK